MRRLGVLILFALSVGAYAQLPPIFPPNAGAGSGIVGPLTGDATTVGAAGTAVTVKGINGVLYATLATGLVKNTTGTGVSSIATAGTDYAVPTTASTWSAKQIFNGGNYFLTAPDAQVGTSYTIVAADESKLLTFSNASAIAVTLPQATTAGFTAGAVFHLDNQGAGTVTVTPTTSTIDGNATQTLTTGQGLDIYSDGTNYFTVKGVAAAGAVSSVSNSDSTLTVSPTTGAVVASINLAHANTWSAAQTFSAASNNFTATGGLTTPQLCFNTTSWCLFQSAGVATMTFSSTTNAAWAMTSNGVMREASTGVYGFVSGANTSGVADDTGLSRDAAGVVDVGNGTAQDVTGTIKPGKYASGTNCTSSASPAVCGSAAAGSFVVAAAATTVTVNTTAVTANSQIFLQEDSSLGSKLSVTCNTTVATAPPAVTARTAATSFAIVTTSPTTNPRCFSYFIVN